MITANDPKDPDDADDFAFDWAIRLADGETITTFAAAVVTGTVTVGAATFSGSRTIVRLTGGTIGEKIQIRYRITTSTGRQLDETLSVWIEIR